MPTIYTIARVTHRAGIPHFPHNAFNQFQNDLMTSVAVTVLAREGRGAVSRGRVVLSRGLFAVRYSHFSPGAGRGGASDDGGNEILMQKLI
eukprot:scaffold3078_cov90-Isochrysis_galbana.AAC.2